MGTYDYETYLHTFGGPPEPGEACPSDLDAAREVAEHPCRCGCEDRRSENGEAELCPLADAHREVQAGA